MDRSSNYLMGHEMQSSDRERRSQRNDDDYDCDDDAFYAEIRRQILLITAGNGDDDDEIDGNRRRCGRKRPPTRGGRVLLQVAPSAGRYFSWCEETDRIFGDSSSSSSLSSSVSTPDWLVNLWSNNKASGSVVGTGVFIPQIVKSGGRSRPRRRRNEGNKMKNKHAVQSV
ncbi:unnamed protein product [Linum trigynum]|uniref:Uncharacterized protein n=1 Tax=Linum trigynum TaxID=586398 RepID=A0AAV2GDK3_9ROSI